MKRFGEKDKVMKELVVDSYSIKQGPPACWRKQTGKKLPQCAERPTMLTACLSVESRD